MSRASARCGHLAQPTRSSISAEASSLLAEAELRPGVSTIAHLTSGPPKGQRGRQFSFYDLEMQLQSPKIASNSAFFLVTKYVNESFHLSPLIHQMVIVDLKLQFIRQ